MNDSIAIWGAGNRGLYLYERLNKYYDIKYFIDKDEIKQRELYCKKPVVSPMQIENISDEINGVVIGVAAGDEQGRILLELHKYRGLYVSIARGINELDLDSNDDIRWDCIDDKVLIPYLECNIVDGCNLNCKGCSHFSNLFSESDGYEFFEFSRDISALSRHIIPYQIRLLGGEPLLKKDIIDYIKVVRDHFSSSDVRLVTNGLLLLSQSLDFWEGLRENDVQLDISLYGPMKKNYGRLEKILIDRNVKYNISGEKTSFKRVLNLNGNSDPAKAYKRCEQKNCTFFRGGRLYRCPNEALISRLIEKYGLSINAKSNGIDFIGKNVDWYSVFFQLFGVGEFCRYCREDGGVEFDWSVSYHPNLEDWWH